MKNLMIAVLICCTTILQTAKAAEIKAVATNQKQQIAVINVNPDVATIDTIVLLSGKLITPNSTTIQLYNDGFSENEQEFAKFEEKFKGLSSTHADAIKKHEEAINAAKKQLEDAVKMLQGIGIDKIDNIDEFLMKMPNIKFDSLLGLAPSSFSSFCNRYKKNDTDAAYNNRYVCSKENWKCNNGNASSKEICIKTSTGDTVYRIDIDCNGTATEIGANPFDFNGQTPVDYLYSNLVKVTTIGDGAVTKKINYIDTLDAKGIAVIGSMYQLINKDNYTKTEYVINAKTAEADDKPADIFENIAFIVLNQGNTIKIEANEELSIRLVDLTNGAACYSDITLTPDTPVELDISYLPAGCKYAIIASKTNDAGTTTNTYKFCK